MNQLQKFPRSILKGALIAALLFGANAMQAELKFEKTVIEARITPGAQSYPFKFPFKNMGEAAVEISEINTSCGCTVAQLEKLTYAPGESGVIQGRFSVGNRQGIQNNTVRVLMKGLAQPEIQLALRLEIPQVVAINPGLLLWRVGSEADGRVLTISPNVDVGAEIVSIECESPDFSVESLPKTNGSADYEAVVTPLKTEARSRGLIRITVAVADAEPKTVFAHALIR